MSSRRRVCLGFAAGALLVLLLLLITRFGSNEPPVSAPSTVQIDPLVMSQPQQADEKGAVEKIPQGEEKSYSVKRLRVSTDNSKAIGFLKTYRRRFFGENAQAVPMADPTRPETVTQWWHAAAIMHWYMNSPLRYKCKKRQSFGNWAACMDSPYTIRPPCLVYSFGIAYDFSFDDAMASHGCEVHSFDPSMAMEDTKRSDHSFFYKLGISNQNSDGYQARLDVYVKAPQVWKMRTLTSIKEMLGHTGRIIDVLKLDIEGHEWAVLDNMMESGELSKVRQLSMEFHIFSDFPVEANYMLMYKSYTKLREELGYLEYWVNPHRPNYIRELYNIQGDSQFVNSFFPYNTSS